MTDYQPLLARALKGLDRNTSEARRAVYDRARQALLNQLRSAAPPMADADITRERLALEDAIRKTETEAVMAEPHAVRAPSAARMPVPPRAPASPPPAAARPSPRIPVAPRIPMPPAASQPQQSAPPPPAAEAPEQNADEREATADTPAPPPLPSAPQPRGPLPSANPLRARPPKPGSGADAGRENREENAPEARASGLPSPELLEELKAELEPSQSPLAPPAQRFERPRPPQRPRGEVPGGDFPPPPPPGARPRPPRAPGQRPPGPGMPPGAARAKAPKPAGNNLWKIVLAGVAVLLIVGAGVLAFTMRGRTPSGSAPQPSVTDADSPKTSERITQSQQDGQGRTSVPSNLDPTVAQRAVLYEENPGGGQQFQNFAGTAVWRTEAVNAPGRAPDLGLRIEAEIPERKINVTLKMRRNTDPSFPASHTIEVIFNVPAGDAFGGVADMRGIRAKGGETAQGNPIAAEVQKVKEGYFLLALPKMQEDANLAMLRDRDWLDVPFVYANGRRAVLTFQKGTPGERALREVLNSWGQGQSQNQNTGSQ